MSGPRGAVRGSLGSWLPCWGFCFLGAWEPLLMDHPAWWLAGSRVFVHAALDRRAAGLLRARLATLDCFLGLLLYIYSH